MTQGQAGVAVWAKSPNASGVPLSLGQHLNDARCVARWLLANFTPAATLLPAAGDGWTEDTLTALVTWLAGVHDIGKASPAFVDVIPAQRPALAQVGLRSRPLVSPLHHSVVGYHVLYDWLVEIGADDDAAEMWSSVVLAHHGRGDAALVQTSSLPESRPDAYGDQAWSKARDWLLREQLTRCGLSIDALERLGLTVYGIEQSQEDAESAAKAAVTREYVQISARDLRVTLSARGENSWQVGLFHPKSGDSFAVEVFGTPQAHVVASDVTWVSSRGARRTERQESALAVT